MNEFQKFSSSIFDFGESSIFKQKDEMAHDILNDKLRLSSKKTEQQIV